MSIKALNGFNHLNGNGHFNGSDTGGLDTSALVNQFNGLFNGSAKKLMSLNSSPENSIIETARGKGVDGMSVVNIKDLVESYAHKFFKDYERDYYKKLGKNVGWRELQKEFNFKNFKVKHEQPVYQDLETPGGGNSLSHILFRSSFVNDTDQEQEYLLRTERKTVSTCEIEIFQGYVCEDQAELSLEIPIPGIVASAGAGFKHEYSTENSTRKSIQEEMTWSLESNVKVASMSQTTAELLVKENQYKGAFECKSYFSGSIRVKLFKDNLEVLSFDLDDLNDILTPDKGFRRDNKGIYCVTKGECKARFGIEQKIQLKQQAITKK